MTEQEENEVIERLSVRLSQYVLHCDVDALADLGVLCFGETDSDVETVRKISEDI